jgi:Protein of unknown function (DUF3040)
MEQRDPVALTTREQSILRDIEAGLHLEAPGGLTRLRDDDPRPHRARRWWRRARTIAAYVGGGMVTLGVAWTMAPYPWTPTVQSLPRS